MFRKSLFANISEEDSMNLTVSGLSAFVSAEIQNHQSKSSVLSESFGIEFEVSLESPFLSLSSRHAGSCPRRYHAAGQRNPEMNP
jgi:hypothetical protein